MSEELKRCPFCRTIATLEKETIPLPNGTDDTMFYVRCVLRECGCRTLAWFPEKAAVAAWNRRTDTAILARLDDDALAEKVVDDMKLYDAGMNEIVGDAIENYRKAVKVVPE